MIEDFRGRIKDEKLCLPYDGGHFCFELPKQINKVFSLVYRDER